MSRNAKIVMVTGALFVLVVIAFTIHMAYQTSPPWEKRKQTIYKYRLDHTTKRLKDSSHVEGRK
ncbi:MAG: hypothetical protein MUF42_07325 [Cytophagaceae bacterium]|jgi:hypothetical protein|nr:hypothetical protein [Cytophagaceae bacterium]